MEGTELGTRQQRPVSARAESLRQGCRLPGASFDEFLPPPPRELRVLTFPGTFLL